MDNDLDYTNDYTNDIDNDYDDYEGTEDSNDSNEVDYSDTHSVAEKLTALLEEPDKTVEEAPSPIVEEEQKFKVKVDGAEREVTLDELKNGYQRQSDYTQKTQELAQQRQAVESEKSQYNQYVQSIPMLAQVAQQNVQAASEQLYSQEMVDLAQTDPAEYVAQKARIEQTIAENSRVFNQMKQQFEEHQNHTSQAHNQMLADVLVHSNKLLAEQIPDWETGDVKTKLKDYALSTAELTADDLNNLYDHRYVKILNKARLYDEMVSKNNVAQKRVAAVPPKTLTSGTSNSNASADDFQARKRAALRSGDSHRIARIMEELL